MRKVDETPALNLLDKVRGYFSPTYAAQAAWLRTFAKNTPRASARGALSTRTTTPWRTVTAGSVSRLSLGDLAKMRARAQELDRDNALASALLNRSVDFCVGKGFTLQAGTGDKAWNRQAEELWAAYWERPEITGLSGLELERLAWRDWHRDGDCGCALINNGLVQLIEGGQLQTPGEARTLDNYYDGVEVDDTFRPIRFHVAVRSENARDSMSAKTRPIPARDFVFLRRLKRHVDVRGTPAMAANFALYDQIDGYVEAAIIAARMSACLGLLVKQSNPSAAYGGLPTAANAQGQQQGIFDLELGSVKFMELQGEIEQVSPVQPGQQFEPLVRTLIRMAAWEMGFPIEIAVMDFSQTTYSSARAALIQAVRSAEPWQAIFVKTFLSRIYRWRISKWMNEGALPMRPDAWKHRFIAWPWQYLDPIKDVQGKMLEVDAGYSTEDDHIMAMGRDPEVVRARRAAEIEEKRRLGIPVMRSNSASPVDGPQQPATSTNVPTDPTDPEDGDSDDDE